MQEDELRGIITEVWCKLLCFLISYRRSRVVKIKIRLNVSPHTEKNEKSGRTVEFVLGYEICRALQTCLALVG